MRYVFTIFLTIWMVGCNTESTSNPSIDKESTMSVIDFTPYACGLEKDNTPVIIPEQEVRFKAIIALQSQRNLSEQQQQTINEGYKALADEGHWKSMNNLASRYLSGSGISRNSKKAVAIFQKMADMNIPLGYYKLASLAENGIGVKQDKEAAWAYFHLAAEKGSPEAQYRLAEIYLYPRHDDNGIVYHHCAYNQGYMKSAGALAAFYKIVAKDYPKALYYYQQSAISNQQSAMAGDVGSLLGLEHTFRTPARSLGYEENLVLAGCFSKQYDELDKNPNVDLSHLPITCPLPPHPIQGLYDPVSDSNIK